MGSEFACGWCESSCEVTQECSNSFVTEGDNCPAPVINSFDPMSGKNRVRVTCSPLLSLLIDVIQIECYAHFTSQSRSDV